jgi:hypothetical protein
LIAREVVPADDREEHDRARFATNLKPQQDLTGFPAGQIQLQDAQHGSGSRATLDVFRRALEAAGVEFIDQNGGGPGVRLRSPGLRS